MPPMEARIVKNIIEYGRDDFVIVMGRNYPLIRKRKRFFIWSVTQWPLF